MYIFLILFPKHLFLFFVYCHVNVLFYGLLCTVFTGKSVYIAHRFILLWLNPFDLIVDREGWWFEHSVS